MKMTPKHTPPTKTNPSFSRNSLSSGQFCTNTVLQTGESLQKSASPPSEPGWQICAKHLRMGFF